LVLQHLSKLHYKNRPNTKLREIAHPWSGEGGSQMPSSLESFTPTTKCLISINAFNRSAAKFFKPSLSFRKPQSFRIGSRVPHQE
jgi:hypothetical protein